MYYIRESLTTVDALAQRGFKCGIDQAMLRNSCQEHEKPGRKCMATTVKAIVGAALIDGGEKAVDRVMNGLGFYEDEWFKELMGDVKMKEDVNKDELEGLSTKMERL
ncbi:hypothetical protein DM02DRAFT_616818 [Periconia macrospinosa]|uniref:RNase III domain-containing protein n=1 Tax=Periconia macrospinosa TaxID=97972 RepID=A0A2V1DFV0_9PLEO|nr:hypothetical protein DM02DRAFT_616818 [Periconia macrospinosa]